MKHLLLFAALLIGITAFGQVKVIQGNSDPLFSLAKKPVFTSFSTSTADYFLIRRRENMAKINQLIVADKGGNITFNKDIWIKTGFINNSFQLQQLVVIGNTPIAFVENFNKTDGKSTLVACTIREDGKVNETGVEVGSLPQTRLLSPVDWYICLTPDKKHIAVIGQPVHEKDSPDLFKYFILDENLKQLSTGEFSFAGKAKRIEIYNFLASDKGDLYILSEDFDKTYKYPTLYKYTTGGQATIIPIMMADPDQKNFNYTSTVNPAGELVIAGYVQKKKTFSMGDTQTTGTWLFNSAKINEVKTFNFDKPVTNLTARNIVYNGNTFYLVGEQYKAERQLSSGSSMQHLGMDESFDYSHNDIMVTGFSADGAKKFDMPLSRNPWVSHDLDQQYMVSSGLINGKLALIYNDQYGKYFDEKSYKNYKLPVAVLITNDGLMEAPIPFAKELDVKVSTYTLYPQFFSSNGGQISVLAGNNSSVKPIVFK
ncbi:hypothetical protein [Mucilaginibacter sp.]|uniref:hypothetical protein n=1 Tax=Mucilaginibacter sp. TaxID=1882438 RepID=UPI002610CCA9|nr:hypothetical protein [Mucilaginibacter sp.]MDB5030060.1 hypothetical protein [Mucilaginibacter sp.]